MNKKRFTYTAIVHFDNCEECPHNRFHDADDDCLHLRCELLNKYIHCYLYSGDKDYRNKDGVLDDCPFLKSNSIINEE